MKNFLGLTILAVLFGFLLSSCEQSSPTEIQGIQNDQVKTATSLSKKGTDNGYGYNEYGYNYNAHMFKGSYFNVYAEKAGFPPYNGDDVSYLENNPDAASYWAWPYRKTNVLMKWNDAWLSKTKERPSNYIGSGAWLTNHMSGVDENGHWTYFIKIVAVPNNAIKKGEIWYTSNGKEIGPVIWGSFAIIQEVESGVGATYISPAGPGLGKW